LAIAHWNEKRPPPIPRRKPIDDTGRNCCATTAGLPRTSAMQGKMESAWIALELALLLMVANDLGDRPAAC
jgi:hypothetical protein